MGIVRKIVVLGALAFVLAAVPASAQTTVPAVEFSGGYNYLHLADDDDEVGSMPAGWYGEVSGNVTPVLGVLFHMTGNYKTVDDFGTDVDFSILTFSGGLRFTARTPQANPFAHVMFGGARSKVSADVAGVSVSDSATDPIMLLGGGVNLLPQSAVGVRLGADYIRSFGDEGGNAFRFNIGLNFGR